MTTTQMYERVAKNVGCSVGELESRHERVLKTNTPALEASGLGAEEIGTKCLRMAAAELRSEKAKLARSGCSMLETCQSIGAHLLDTPCRSTQSSPPVQWHGTYFAPLHGRRWYSSKNPPCQTRVQVRTAAKSTHSRFPNRIVGLAHAPPNTRARPLC